MIRTLHTYLPPMNDFWILENQVVINDAASGGEALGFYTSPPESYQRILFLGDKKIWVKK